MRLWLLATLALLALPVQATHVDGVSWACGGGGQGQSGHPDQCGIDPVGGEGVGSAGPPEWGDAWVGGDALILGVIVNDAARAVPVAMLDRHEIANVEIAGEPVAITYCPLCGSGISFERRVSLDTGIQTLDFTASGFLYQHDLVMWDSQTSTLWTQIRGEPIGTLRNDHADTDHHGVRLQYIPTEVTTWKEWEEHHPDSLMLQKAPGYSYGGAYPGYDGSCRFGISSQSDCDVQGLHPKEIVFGIESPRGDVAVPRFAFNQADVVITDQGVIVARHSAQTVAFDAGRHTFTTTDDGWVDEGGNRWDLTTGQRADGVASLHPLIPLQMYWFAWEEHHPGTALFMPNNTSEALLLHDNGKLPGFTIGIVVVFLVAVGLVLRRLR